MYGTKVLWDRGMLDQDACIVGEPSDLRVGLAERGGRLDHGDRARQGSARLATEPRRQRDHVDVPADPAAVGGAPRPRAPARRDDPA